MKPEYTIESVLFASGEPVALTELASLLKVSKPGLIRLLEQLRSDYAERGIRLVFDERNAQLVTAPEVAGQLAKFIQAELRGKLSPGALETLAIIAYRGAVTRPQIDAIRGVHSGQALRTLAVRGLITEVGRTTDPGRPILYDTTLEVYKQLGISGRSELPEVPEALRTKLDAVTEQKLAEA